MNKLTMFFTCFILGLSCLQAQATTDTSSVDEWFNQTAIGKECNVGESSWVVKGPTQKHVIKEEGQDDYTFYQIQCGTGTSNLTSVYVLEGRRGYEILEFYQPYVEYIFKNQEEIALESWALIGFGTTFYLHNPTFDSESLTIKTRATEKIYEHVFYKNLYVYSGGEWVLTKSIAAPTESLVEKPIVVFENQ